MTDITGRLSGVTVLVAARPFLLGYICGVMADANAIVLTPPLAAGLLLDRVPGPVIACIEIEALQELAGIMPSFDARAIPSLMLLPIRTPDERFLESGAMTLRRPFAGFQIVDALAHLLRAGPDR